MKKFIIPLLVTILAAITPAKAQEAEKTCEALFVHSADSISLDNKTITMKGASPTVTFFCDRPVRMAGHLRFEEFLNSVSKGENSFATNPPNAVVSIVNDNEIVDVVVELTKEPIVNADEIVFDNVKILEGEVSMKEGKGSLFIDPIGRPITPTSVAGVHRRHERRRVRRCAAGITCY